MMTMHARLARIDDGGRDGTFTMILATNGEASDGHVLSIRGGEIPATMPLLMSHENNPRSHLGTVSDARKGRDGDLDVIRATGTIEMGGSGPLADVRRDVAHMIAEGHIRGVSLRWDPIRFVPRTELPPSHPAHVPGDEPDVRKRWGLYFSAWRALEGSVVSLGADPAALIGRANATTGETAVFWRRFAATSADRFVPIEEHDRVLAMLAEARAVASALRPTVGTSSAVPRTNDGEDVLETFRRRVHAMALERDARIRAAATEWRRTHLGKVE